MGVRCIGARETRAIRFFDANVKYLIFYVKSLIFTIAAPPDFLVLIIIARL